MKTLTPVVLCVLSALLFLHLVTGSLIVDTPVGKILGKKETTPNNKSYVLFANIPYAKPPVGDLRFEKPEPHPAFVDIFNATEKIVACPQPEVFVSDEERGTEDCLVLNIYLKDLNSSPGDKRKVLVYIHDGGFVKGSSRTYAPMSFVSDHDVIVITINYRLGVLGFLSSQNEASPGNYGLWDQALALKWIKDNIAAFGGDPDDITIAGASAGASSVSFLSLSPVTKSLFTKAYSHSGGATSLFAQTTDPKLDFITVAQATNCWERDQKIDVAQAHQIVKCLKTRPAKDLTNMQLFTVDKTSFVPVVDGEFLPRHPSELLSDYDYLESVGFFNILNLISFNNNEKAVLETSFGVVKKLIYNRADITAEEKAASWTSTMAGAIRNALKSKLNLESVPDSLVDKVYFWYERRVGDQAVSNIISDMYFTVPAFDILDALARSRSASAWLLYFNYYPQFVKGPSRGMAHGLDLAYWLDYPLLKLESVLYAGIEGDFSEEDGELKKLFSSVLAEFMKTGIPGKTLKDQQIADWPKFNSQDAQYLDFNLRPSVQSHLEKDKRELWRNLIPLWVSELRNPQKPEHSEL